MSSLSFSKIKPKNKEQDLAINKGLDFLSKGDPSEPFGIFGKAGTGKTTIGEAIIEPYIGKRDILIMALAHKAKNVLNDKLIKAYGEDIITAKSIAGALGMSMDQETGRFMIDKNFKGTPAIKTHSLILCDEGSMVNEEAKHLIMSHKKKNAKVIFFGDRRQLPPIREQGSEFADLISPIFFTTNYAVLTERIRQGEESPILPFSDYFGDNAIAKMPLLNPAPGNLRKNIITDKGALAFADDIEDVIQAALPLYRLSVDTKNFDIVKTVSYRNDARKKANNNIRSLLFGPTGSRQQFVVGDLLMFNDNYSIDGVKEPIENSQEIQVNHAEQKHDGYYKIWEVGFIHESRPMHINVLDKSEVERHSLDVSRKFDYAKSFAFGSPDRVVNLGYAWELKKKYAPVEYAYAITSHKAQGSTYGTVIVDEGDIMSVGPTSVRAKSQSMYVGITRGATTCIMIDGQTPDKTLFESIQLSLSKT